jgi:hypothetical protein
MLPLLGLLRQAFQWKALFAERCLHGGRRDNGCGNGRITPARSCDSGGKAQDATIVEDVAAVAGSDLPATVRLSVKAVDGEDC